MALPRAIFSKQICRLSCSRPSRASLPRSGPPVATLCVVLLITYLVTSADSAVLVINTIVSGGAPDGVRPRHIVLWSVLLGLVIITLLFAGGMDALRSVMIIGALPFSAVMFFMLCALATH